MNDKCIVAIRVLRANGDTAYEGEIPIDGSEFVAINIAQAIVVAFRQRVKELNEIAAKIDEEFGNAGVR